MKKYGVIFVTAMALLLSACSSDSESNEPNKFAGYWVNAGLLKNKGEFCELIESTKDMTDYERLQVTGYMVNYGGGVFALDLGSNAGYNPASVWRIQSNGQTKTSRLTKANKQCNGCEDINSQSMELSGKGQLLVTWNLENSDNGKFSEAFEYQGVNRRTLAELRKKAAICKACSIKLDKVCTSDDLKDLEAKSRQPIN